jgi:hypothetical protein
MRFIAGYRAVAAAMMFLAGGLAAAQVAPRGVPAIGVNAYPSFGGAPVAGPVGARGFYGGGFAGYQPVLGFLGGWGGGAPGYSDGYGDSYIAPGGNAAVYNYYYHDKQRREGFYGGGGVFYADDGYSRIYVHQPRRRGYDDDEGGPAGTGYAPVVGAYTPMQHVFDLTPPSAPAPRRAPRKAAHD